MKHSDFLDVSYLLFYGDLPSAREKVIGSAGVMFLSSAVPTYVCLPPMLQLIHEKDIKAHMMVHQKLLRFYDGFQVSDRPCIRRLAFHPFGRAVSAEQCAPNGNHGGRRWGSFVLLPRQVLTGSD